MGRFHDSIKYELLSRLMPSLALILRTSHEYLGKDLLVGLVEWLVLGVDLEHPPEAHELNSRA